MESETNRARNIRLYRCGKLILRLIRIDNANSIHESAALFVMRRSAIGLAIDAFAIEWPVVFRVPGVSGDQSSVQSFLIDGIYPRPGCCIYDAGFMYCHEQARGALNYPYPCQTRRYGITCKPLKTADNAASFDDFLNPSTWAAHKKQLRDME